MNEVQVAIAANAGAIRCFYIFEDDPTRAMQLLRAAFPELGDGVRLYSPLNEAVATALRLEPGQVLEWRIGVRINARSLIDPLAS